MQQNRLRWCVGIRARECQSIQMSLSYYYCFRWVSSALHKQSNCKDNIRSVYNDQRLHGFQRGSNAFFAEPLESWLSVMSNAVPFIHNCLVVAPSTLTSERLRALLHRAQAHFPQVHVAQLKKNINGISFQKQWPSSQLASEEANSTTCLSPPVHFFTSPLEEIAEKSLDVIVFADNVFGNEMLFDSPWHISLAAKALRPHGVLALFGYSSQVEIPNPTWAKENVVDYSRAHRENVQAAIAEKEKMKDKECFKSNNTTTTSTAHCVADLTDNLRCTVKDEKVFRPKDNRECDYDDDDDDDSVIIDNRWKRETNTRQMQLTNALRCAWDAECSINTGHADTYLPFLAVRRAWFVSEYALSNESLIAYLRSSQTYNLLHKLQNSIAEINRNQEECSKYLSDDFIDVEEEVHNNEKSSMLSLVGKSSSDNNEWSKENTIELASMQCNSNIDDVDDNAPVFVQRRASEVDHLEALYYCLHDHLHSGERNDLLRCQEQQHQQHEQGYMLSNSRQTHSAFPPLRARIRHFAVTCSNRSMNSIDKFNKFVKLPSTTGPYLPNS